MSDNYSKNVQFPRAFDRLESVRQWVSWRVVVRDGKPTKVPYSPDTGQLASAKKPATWATYTDAAERADKLLGRGDKGGVGIMLGRIIGDEDWSLGGVDLDSCLDDRGRLDPWAAEIVDRLDAYAEVSPSGSGVKAFFLYRTSELPTLTEGWGDRFGRQWKAGSHHGVELYLDRRYFAVTGERVERTHSAIEPVRTTDVVWLINVAGPAVRAQANGAPNEASDAGSRDDSGSGHGFRFLLDQAKASATEDEALAAVRDDEGAAGEWANRTSDRELDRAWRNAAAQIAKRDDHQVARMPEGSSRERSSGLTFKSPNECAASEARPYVIKRLIAQGDIACIVGAPGAGKSLLAPYLAYRVAQGEKVFGMRTRKGGVFYVAAEDEHGMGGRIDALRLHYDDAPDFVLVGGVSDLLRKDSPNLVDLQKAIAERRPVLVVIDTLAMAFPGLEENSAEGMGRVVAVAKSLTTHGAAVLLVHHDTKDGQQGLPRGHSILNGALDVAILVRRDDKVVRCRLTKNRNGPSDREFAFTIATSGVQIDDDQELVRAAYAREIAVEDVSPKAERIGASAKAALDIFRHLLNGRDAVPEGEWREAAIGSRAVSAADNPDSRRKAFKRAVEELTRKRLVVFDGKDFSEGDSSTRSEGR